VKHHLELNPLEGDFGEVLARILAYSATNTGTTSKRIHFLNAYTIACAVKDEKLADIYNSGTQIFDGAPLVLLCKYWLNIRNVSRCRGTDILRSLLEVEGISHYFLGGTEESIKILIDTIRETNNRIQISGYEALPFDEIFESLLTGIVERINQSKPNFIWVGIGTPKQDYFAERLAKLTPFSTVLTVGAAFDFLSGSKAEAPRILQRFGLEWLFRLSSEPKRLWKRYLYGNFIFLKFVAGYSNR
jgi:N-acetylglucosaminyldiphosphoundecaprenol N-acetyl-beta-D-mannosaminyltransferase